jgi:drug/metabolite transporter (DMT)-like permease
MLAGPAAWATVASAQSNSNTGAQAPGERGNLRFSCIDVVCTAGRVLIQRVFSPISPVLGSDTRRPWLCDSKRRMDEEQNSKNSGSFRARRRQQFLGYGACALAGSLWGTGFYFGRLALNEMSVEHMVLYRFLFACLGIAPVVVLYGLRRRGKPGQPGGRVRLTGQEIRLLLIASTFGIPIQFLVQFHGLALTTVSHASLMVGAMPVLLAAAAAIFAKERLNAFGWSALVASTAGAALVTLGGHRGSARGGPSLTGDLMVLASLATALVWILLSKKLLETHSPKMVTACTLFAGTTMLAAVVAGEQFFALLTHSAVEPFPFAHVSLRAWLALAASGILCTATTTLLWNWGLHNVPASRAGVFLNIEPALGSVLGVELLGERLGPFAWLGGALILGAALALTLRAHEPEPQVLLE